MKIFKTNLKLLLLVLPAFILTSCVDDLEGMAVQSKPTATTTLTALSVAEGEIGLIPFTISEPINVPSQFKILVDSNTLSEDDVRIGDQEIDGDTGIPGTGFEITVPPFATSFDIPVEAILDIFPEDSETATLRISAAGVRTILIPGTEHEVDLTITNNATTNFSVSLEWDTIYVDADGDEHHACDFDLDLELYTEGFDFVGASYSSCPEEISFSAGDLPDGNYWLVPSFWSVTSGVAPAVDFQVPAKITFAKPGVWIETVDLTDVWDTATGGYVQNNPDAYLVKFVLTIEGTTYTITDADTGSVLVSGKMAPQSKSKLPADFVPGRLR